MKHLGASASADQALAVPAGPVARPDPTGFDPSRGEIGELTVIYATGWNAAIKHCAGIAERWRDQNIVQRTRARKSGRRRYDFDGDETMLVMAEQLDGAAAECDAIAVEIRAQAIAMEARQGRDAVERPDPEDDSAGPKDIAQGEQP